jgi:hypothetical protein
MMKQSMLWPAFLFMTFWSWPSTLAQEGACTKPKVAVELGNFYSETFEVLIRQYPFKTKEQWIQDIQNEMLEKLRANSPDVAIFPMGSAPDYEYYIRYYVAVIGCGEEEIIGGLTYSKDTCYWIIGTLYSKDACDVACRHPGI